MSAEYRYTVTIQRRGVRVPRYQIFVIRAVVGLGIAVVMSRFFFQRIEPLTVGGLAIFLVGMSYVTEYFRNRKK